MKGRERKELRGGMLRMGPGDFFAPSILSFLNHSFWISPMYPQYTISFENSWSGSSTLFFAIISLDCHSLTLVQNFLLWGIREKKKKALPFPFNFTASNIPTRGNFDLVSRHQEQRREKGTREDSWRTLIFFWRRGTMSSAGISFVPKHLDGAYDTCAVFVQLFIVFVLAKRQSCLWPICGYSPPCFDQLVLFVAVLVYVHEYSVSRL